MTAGTPSSPAGVSLIVETDPSPESIRFLEERLYDFNVRTTGAEGNLIGLFLRTADGSQLGGVYGWSWGGTCYVRYLFVAESMRGRGEGTSTTLADLLTLLFLADPRLAVRTSLRT